MTKTRMLITGATGMVGQNLARRAVQEGYRVRAFVRKSADTRMLEELGIECAVGDLLDPDSFPAAVSDMEIIVHAAARVGDWGRVEEYRAVNVHALDQFLQAVRRAGSLKRWVQISSLGVYPASHHQGLDESTPPNLNGFDGYTRTKAEADILLRQHMDEYGLPAVMLRPGFMYGIGDRHVVPRVVETLRTGSMRIIGDGNMLLDNTYVGHLVDAILLAAKKEGITGEAFNIRDRRLVTRNEFIGAIAAHLNVPMPRRVPLWFAKAAVGPIEGFARLFRFQRAPLLTHARMKFMAINLDYSIDKAGPALGFQPRFDFQEKIQEALDALDAATSRQTRFVDAA